MKKLFLGLMVTCGAWARPDSLIPPDPGYTNGFARSNPGYRQRAAESYEKTYFPVALAQLRRATGLPEDDLHRVLQGFVYRWLDRYVELEGHMPADDLAEVVGWLDGEMRERLHPKPTGSYERWKASPENSLAFLFRVHQ
ncbi:MAG: hypothetical protein KF760_26815 [Candidatus Eremiobacteraeota bacterium]|nr:hypothetical protein [Candidatus Eremiobacteraeota bacterium]MCW5868847.1 hypothetical protein [Candidatus Eremiobacteraeota bacterium]